MRRRQPLDFGCIQAEGFLPIRAPPWDDPSAALRAGFQLGVRGERRCRGRRLADRPARRRRRSVGQARLRKPSVQPHGPSQDSAANAPVCAQCGEIACRSLATASSSTAGGLKCPLWRCKMLQLPKVGPLAWAMHLANVISDTASVLDASGLTLSRLLGAVRP